MPSITRLLTGMFASSSKTLVSVSALAALWAASRGIFGMLTGLNRIYNVQEDRGYVFTRLLSLVYTFLFLLVLLLTLALHVFGQTILAQLPQSDNPAMLLLLRVISSRFLVLLLLQTALFTAMFMFLPNRRNKFLPSLPGALLASLGWQLFSDFFSLTWSTSAIFHGIRQPVCGSHCHAVAVHLRCHCVLRRRPQQISGRHRLPAPPAAVGEGAGAGMLKKVSTWLLKINFLFTNGQ